MADVINYTNLFNRIRVLVKYFNLLEVRQTGTGAGNFPLPYIKNQIIDVFETQGETDEVATLEAEFANAITSQTTLKFAILTWFEAMLHELGEELGEYALTDAPSVLERLADAMTKDSQTIEERLTEVAAADVEATEWIKAHTGNEGTGKLVYTFSQPGLTPNELSHEEIMHCECIAAIAAGEESFQLVGETAYSRESHHAQGSGLGPVLVAFGESITNGDFEDWTSTAADGWTAATGTTWGTHLEKDTDSLRNTYCIEGNLDTSWQITTPLPITLEPNTVYVVSIWAKKAATATGHVYIEIVDSDTATPTQVVTDELDIDVAALTTSYALKHAIIITPGSIGEGWRLSIRADTLAVADCFLDAIQFGPMAKHNGIHFALCSGGTDFGVGDKFGYGGDNLGFKVQVSSPGVIQKFLGRCFNTQLPSATVPTEADPV